MDKVGDIYYSSVMRVLDGNGDPVTTLVNADFTAVVYKNGVVAATPVPTIYHLGSGNYQAQFTPNAVGIWTLIITEATYAPDGWTENIEAYPIDAELEYTGALCTLAEIHDELDKADTDTNSDVLFSRLISSVTSEIIAYTGIQFVAKSVINEYHNIDEWQGKVFLDYYPIFTVSAIYDDGALLTYNADPQLTDYHINNGYIEKEMGYFTPGKKRFKVSYVAFKSVPYEIKECAIQMVAIKSGKKTRTFIDGEGISQAMIMTSIPKDIRAVLDRYKRVVI